MDSTGEWDLPWKLVRQYLESLAAAGVQQWPRVEAVPAAQSGPDSIASANRAVSESRVNPSPSESDRAPHTVADPPRSGATCCRGLFDSMEAVDAVVPPEARADALNGLAAEVAACVRCADLAARRTQTVFGVGNPLARLCFFGEAPGADEDRQGEPFVGRAGQLLNKILAACRLRREDVYILNVLKCRPPDNRTPAPDEVTNCRPFFQQQLAILRPEFICCLGSVAAGALLETKQSLARLRGQLHRWHNSTVVVTYHPAYLLRNPAAKADTWEDMKLLMRAMGSPVDEPAR